MLARTLVRKENILFKYLNLMELDDISSLTCIPSYEEYAPWCLLPLWHNTYLFT